MEWGHIPGERAEPSAPAGQTNRSGGKAVSAPPSHRRDTTPCRSILRMRCLRPSIRARRASASRPASRSRPASSTSPRDDRRSGLSAPRAGGGTRRIAGEAMTRELRTRSTEAAHLFFLCSTNAHHSRQENSRTKMKHDLHVIAAPRHAAPHRQYPRRAQAVAKSPAKTSTCDPIPTIVAKRHASATIPPARRLVTVALDLGSWPIRSTLERKNESTSGEPRLEVCVRYCCGGPLRCDVPARRELDRCSGSRPRERVAQVI